MKKSPVVRVFCSAVAVVLTTFALTVFAVEKVNINSASASELASVLKGVGPAKAEAIVAHREKQGPFTEKEQLMDVQGIGKVVFSENTDAIVVDVTNGQ